MDLLNNLALGFATALSSVNLLYCLIGVLLGTLIGVLPGIGPTATIAMLLPITFTLEPASALIMLAGIYYGAQYGGSTTAILVNIPGEASSVVTTLDGYQMARKGRAGAALAIAAIGSLAGGCIATALIVLAAPPLTEVAMSFRPADYFSMMVLGMIGAVVLARGDVVKAIGMVLIGLVIGIVGTDANSGVQRFTFGSLDLYDGFDIVAIFMGAFGIAEIVRNLEAGQTQREVLARPVSSLMPNRDEARRSVGPILRGTVIGSLLGILPGGGALVSSYASYALEKRISRTPELFGTGMVEGVAGPETANNAAAQTSFIPMLTLGIPSNVVMAMMIGAMMIQGINPGPQVMALNPAIFWGLIVSMWIGNLILVVLNLPLIGMWVRLLQVPYRLLFPAIIVFMSVGALSLSNNPADIVVMAFFGLLGVVCAKLELELAPMALGVVLGPLLEENMRRAMLLSRGDATVFLTEPISAAFLFTSVLLLATMVLPALRRKRETVFVEED